MVIIMSRLLDVLNDCSVSYSMCPTLWMKNIYIYIYLLTNLESLQLRRIRLDLNFTFKLLNGIINCSELLVKFNFLVPASHTRNSNTFYMPFHRTNYAKNSPIMRLMGSVNKNNVDLFFCNNIAFLNIYLNNNVNIIWFFCFYVILCILT